MSIIQYAGVNALVSSLAGKLMNREQYLDLIDLKTVGDVLKYLRENTHYREELQDSPQDLHRGEIEHLLKQQLLKDYSRIISFLSGGTRIFFKNLFIRFEVEDVKLLLRTIFIEQDPAKLQSELLHLGHYSSLDMESLSRLHSIEEVARVLQGTGYGEIISRYVDKNKESGSLFQVEMALDIYYFQRVWSLTRFLGSEDRIQVHKILGTQADLLNIQWIYRAVKFYHIESGVMLGYTLPIRYRLSLQDIRSLIQAQDTADFWNRLKSTAYHDLFRSMEGAEDILFERNLLSYQLHQALQSKIQGTFNIGKILGYLQIRETEMRDITTILEGVRYGMQAEKIAPLAVNTLTR